MKHDHEKRARKLARDVDVALSRSDSHQPAADIITQALRESYEAGLEAAAVQVSIYKIGNPRTPREQAKAIRALKSKNGGE